MNELPEIYRRIEYLRNKGVKMKEIADHTNMAASVLSSLYSSVLPTYIGCIKKGNNEEEALDYALSQVNNVSKKHLLGNLKELKEQLYALEPAVATGQKENPFLDMLSEEMLRSVQDAYNYSVQPFLFDQCPESRALSYHNIRKQRLCESRTHERLQYHPFRNRYFQQPPELLHHIQ